VFGVCLFLFISVALGSDNSDDDSSEGDLFVFSLDTIIVFSKLFLLILILIFFFDRFTIFKFLVGTHAQLLF
jgi:hypothetical protein